MNFRQLECFVAVVDEGSFTRAARRVGISQPSLSQHIRTLEADVDGALFDRLPHGVSLTPAGRVLLPEARIAVRALERGKQSTRSALAFELGELEIATVLSMAVGVLPYHIAVWHARHPNVSIRLHEFLHRTLLEDAVEQGVADFAIGPKPVRSWDGPLETVGWEEFVVVVASSDPLARRRQIKLEELHDRDWVLYHPNHGLAGIVEEACRRSGFTPRGTVRTSQAEGAVRLAAAGLGIALVPENIVVGGIDCGVVQLDPRLVRQVAVYARVACRRRRPRSSRGAGGGPAPAERLRDALPLAVRPYHPLVRRAASPIVVGLVLVLSACGGSGAQHTDSLSGPVPTLSKAVTRTVAAGTARFAQRTAIVAAGSAVHADANGAASLRVRLGHIYKLNPGGGIPGEIIVIGPFTYTNANVEAALSDPSVPPWTKLDARRLNARERATQADDLAHAVAPAYLADGVAHPTLVTSTGGRTVYRGTVDPVLLERRLPKASSSWIMRGVRADYPNRPFDARFWLDASGRARRVLVAYRTPAGTPVSVDTRYSDFGTPVDVSLPRASQIKDVTPAR